MIEQDYITRCGITLLERISDDNSLSRVGPQYSGDRYMSCLVVRLDDFILNEKEFKIFPTQEETEVSEGFQDFQDGMLVNDHYTNLTKHLLLIHIDDFLNTPNMYSRGVLKNSWGQLSIKYQSSGFKIYNSESPRLVPTQKFLLGWFNNEYFTNSDTSLSALLRSLQVTIFWGVGLLVHRYGDLKRNVYEFDKKTNLRLIKESSGISGIKSGQFIL